MTRLLFRTAALALIGLLTFPSASAQSRHRDGQRGDRGRHAAEMQQAVGLSDAQAAQIRTILQAQRADRPERSRDSARPTEAQREAMHAQHETRRAETTRQIEAVMTTEQVARFRAFKEAHHAERGERRGARRIESMRESLGLSDQQVQQLQTIAQAQRATRPERSTDSARPTEAQREAMRAQRQTQRNEMRRQIEAVLTPEQTARFEALRAEHREERGGQRGNRRGRRTRNVSE